MGFGLLGAFCVLGVVTIHFSTNIGELIRWTFKKSFGNLQPNVTRFSRHQRPDWWRCCETSWTTAEESSGERTGMGDRKNGSINNSTHTEETDVHSRTAQGAGRKNEGVLASHEESAKK